MKLFVTFKQLNPEFDKIYAEQYHLGEESDGNTKTLWEQSIECKHEVETISIIENGTLNLKVKNKDEKEISLNIENMTILQAKVDSGAIVQFAVSKELVEKTHKAYNEKYSTTRFYFYFKQREDYLAIGEDIYILEEDLPEEIKI